MRWALHGSALFLAGCTGAPRLLVELHHGGFRPGCLVLLATLEGAPVPQSVEIPLLAPERAGERLVAVFAQPGQGPRVSLEAQAREGSCGGPVVARALAEGVVGSGGAPLEMALSASDPDDDGYISNLATLPGTDCREGDPHVHPKPSGEAACDGVDDDCQGDADDSFGVGQPCDAGGCPGALVCDGPTSARCNAVLADWYEDLDRDGAGTGYLGRFCGPDAGLAATGGDCDDGDAYVRPGAAEVCDGKDDNCDGRPEDLDGGTCVRYLLPPGTDLLAVSSSGRGTAWAAGSDGGLYLLTSDGGIEARAGICGSNDWSAVFADPWDRPYLGAPLARVAYAHDAGANACLPSSAGVSAQVTGIWGYPQADRGSQAFMVTSGGHLVYWAPPSAPQPLFQVGSGSDNLRALDGVAPYPRIAAGWLNDGVIHPRVWVDRGGGFVEQGVEALVGAGLAMRAVRMPRADLAYACGGRGAVLELDGGTWSRLPSPSPEQPDLSSIAAFDERHVYVAGSGADASWVWSWDGTRWTPLVRLSPDAGSVHAIAGTGPDDLWVVGRGSAWHLSLPP